MLADDEDVAECAVIGVADAMKGQLPLGFLVPNTGTKTSSAELAARGISRVREAIGPVAAFRLCVVVQRLPKTRSGKILRGTLRKIANDEPWTMPATVDEPQVFKEIAQSLSRLGYPPE